MESVPEQPEVTNKAEGDSLGSGSNGFISGALTLRPRAITKNKTHSARLDLSPAE